MDKALICGYPRSGNSLLFRIMVSLQGPDYLSFMDSVGLTSLARAQCADFMSFPEIAHLDNLRLPDGITHLEYPHPSYRMVPVAPSLLDQVSTLIWTHELPQTVMRSHFSSRKNLYMIRDGRDAITSMIHYSVKARSRRLRPQYEIQTAEEVYSNINLFKKWSIEWATHVDSYLIQKNNFYGVHYEDLVKNPENGITKIIEYAFPSMRSDQGKTREGVEAALVAADRNSFRAKAPDHVHKGRPGGWKEEWTDQHIDLFFQHAGGQLSRLGYV